MASITDRLKNAFNAFSKPQSEEIESFAGFGGTSGYGLTQAAPPDRFRIRAGNERTIVTSIYTRISIDIASVILKHIRLDD